MKILEVLYECEEVWVDDDENIVEEGFKRQVRKVGDQLKKRFRCSAGPKAGKLVTSPADCGKRKDPKKVRQGRKVMRGKKGTIKRKTKLSKRKQISKIVTRMNKRLAGKPV
jgi:hypothetical protein